MNPQGELELIRNILGKVDTPMTSEEILSFALQGIKVSFDCLAVSIVLYGPRQETFKVVISKGWSNDFIKRFHGQRFDGLVRDMAGRDQPLEIAPGDPRHQAKGYQFQHAYRSLLAVPMGIRNRKVGFLYLSTNRDKPFDSETVNVLRDLANLCTLILDYGSLGDQVLSLSYIDPLTGLYSYKFWHEELDREIARSETLGSVVSLMEIRLNRVREYNSMHGHVKGDYLLVDMSAMIKDQLGALHVPCRVGAKWYVVLVGENAEGAKALAEKVIRAMESRPPEGDPPLTISVGLSTYTPGEGERSLIRRVEEAVHEARRLGVNTLKAL